ncbi:C40 family peptidase [Streptomyces sp. ODS05-4]|uniref:C40 family peptidase n=1 Tax=Streptomyces sp. ODS05-4 TaxID=2944939 RepID=UPI00272EA3C5|nr:C40 family peptidase [Streptomyces sp. ODS05-4]
MASHRKPRSRTLPVLHTPAPAAVGVTTAAALASVALISAQSATAAAPAAPSGRTPTAGAPSPEEVRAKVDDLYRQAGTAADGVRPAPRGTVPASATSARPAGVPNATPATPAAPPNRTSPPPPRAQDRLPDAGLVTLTVERPPAAPSGGGTAAGSTVGRGWGGGTAAGDAGGGKGSGGGTAAGSTVGTDLGSGTQPGAGPVSLRALKERSQARLAQARALLTRAAEATPADATPVRATPVVATPVGATPVGVGAAERIPASASEWTPAGAAAVSAIAPAAAEGLAAPAAASGCVAGSGGTEVGGGPVGAGPVGGGPVGGGPVGGGPVGGGPVGGVGVAALGGEAARVVAFAEAQLGKPYVRGAAGPSSYDCAGLVRAAWKAAGVELPRSAGGQAMAGAPVAMGQMRAGDLVFFHGDSGHVGIYKGDGMMIHAPGPGAGVREESVFSMPIRGSVRPA